MSQTLRGFKSQRAITAMTDILEKLVTEVPIYELINRPEPQAAHLSHDTMVVVKEN